MFFIIFFKQMTEYEVRISDCVSDVCSSDLTNNTLLLSPKAQIDTKPQLEIFADDVKCTHGATVGQLDETATFYMKSRGVGAAMTRQLLTYAFRSDERRRGKEGVSTCRYRWTSSH